MSMQDANLERKLSFLMYNFFTCNQKDEQFLKTIELKRGIEKPIEEGQLLSVGGNTIKIFKLDM